MSKIGNNNYQAMANKLTMADITKWLNADNKDETRRLQFVDRTVTAAKTSGVKMPKSSARLQLATLKSKDGAANETARQVFLLFILRECRVDSIDKLPQSVKTAMKLDGGFFVKDDWKAGKKRPLSARRVKAVKTAIESVQSEMKKAGMNLKSASSKAFLVGLDSNLRDKLLSGKETKLLKALYDGYVKSKDKDDYLLCVNQLHAKGKSLKSTFPLGVFHDKGNGKDPVGKCIENQLRSSDIHFRGGDGYAEGVSYFARVLDSFSREKAVLKIQDEPKIFDTKKDVFKHTTPIRLAGTGNADRKIRFYDGVAWKEIDLGLILDQTVGKSEKERETYKKQEQALKKLYGVLSERTGLKGDNLLVFLSKASSAGLSFGGSDDNDFLREYRKQKGIGDPHGMFGLGCKWKSTVTVKRDSDDKPKYMTVHQNVGTPISSYKTAAGDEITYGKGSKVSFDMTYKYVADMENKNDFKPTISEMTYDANVSLTGFEKIMS